MQAKSHFRGIEFFPFVNVLSTPLAAVQMSKTQRGAIPHIEWRHEAHLVLPLRTEAPPRDERRVKVGRVVFVEDCTSASREERKEKIKYERMKKGKYNFLQHRQGCVCID